ncbi:MAG TPA: ATP-binding cassette domain-containing protein, partial [Bacteroidetes bacterium]|nr:ATP-binding cassette domain-containing protein [Bacteroidota bacterium]
MLKIENVSYSVENKRILDSINLEVQRGTIHSILGANGTGKTTLGYVIMGLSGYKPTEGKIYFEGEDITDLSITERARRGITLAWQYSTPFEGITVKDYLSIAAKQSGYDYNEALKRVGLD